jgi:hypothetical protein
MSIVTLFVLGLVLPSPAAAWKPKTHIYTADLVMANIMAGQNTVTVGGRQYPVPVEVAGAIRAHPDDFRGGAVGPDAFPDIPGGQGNIHPDTRTNNGAVATPDPSPGHSFTWEWLDHIYSSAWAAYSTCGGCDAGKRDLAFAYGYLVHAAGDVWGHTFVNDFARGTFPAISELTDPAKLAIALRHTVVEGYVDKHVPAGAALTIDAPVDFLYSTFIDNSTAASYGRGLFVEKFLQLRQWLVDKEDSLTKYIDSGWWPGCANPADWVSCVERAYVRAWRDDIDSGLRAYPTLSLKLARDLFTNAADPVGQAKRDVGDYANAHLYSMLGLPDFFGDIAGLTDSIANAIRSVAAPIVAPIDALKDQFYNWIVKQATGQSLDEWASYFKNPDAHINSAAIGLAADTSARVDRLMSLPRSGIGNTQGFDPTRFAAIKNTIALGQLALLDGDGLNAVLQAHGVAAHYFVQIAPRDNVMAPISQVLHLPWGIQLPLRAGWARSIDGDHQWMKISPRDNHQYGDGSFFLWQDCKARNSVFRGLFTDWENATGFPNDDGARCALPKVTKLPTVSGTAQPGATLTCTRGEWTDADTFAYTWLLDGGPVSSAGATYQVLSSQVGHAIACRLSATNANGTTNATSASVTVTSPAIPPPGMVKPPTITGVPQPPNRLTCSSGQWSGAPSYGYRWLADGKATTVAGAAYLLANRDVGHRIACVVAATNAGGTTSATSAAVMITAARDVVAPALTRLTLSPLRFHAANSGRTIVTGGKTGARLTFRLSERALVKLTIESQTVSHGHTRRVLLKGSVSLIANQGLTRQRFTGRWAGKQLRPGRYRIIASARDSAGNKSAAVRSAVITILR